MFNKFKPVIALMVLVGMLTVPVSAVFAGTTHTEGGLVNNSADGTPADGSGWRVYKSSDTSDRATGVVGTPTPGYWRGDVGAALVNQWLVNDNHVCVIDKEIDAGLATHKGYYAIISKNLTSNDPDPFPATTLRLVPKPNPTPASGSVNLTWSAAVTEVPGDVTKYQVWRSENPAGPFTFVGTADGVTTYNDTTVSSGHTYYYAIKLIYRTTAAAALVSYLSESSIAVTPLDTVHPNPPVNLMVFDPGTGSTLDLTWTAPTTNEDGSPLTDLAGYNIYRSLVSGGPYTKVNGAVVTSTNYTDPGLTLGTTYYYVVRAVDTSNNESINSNQASGTPTLYIGIDLYEFNEGINYYLSGSKPDEIAITFNQEASDKIQGISSGQLFYSHDGNPAKWGGYLGGILPVNLSIASANGVSFWLKGDGSNNTIRVDLKESSVFPANGEVWSSRDVPMKDTTWHKVDLPYNQFTRNPYDGVTGGNNTFDKNIAQYQLLYTSKEASAAYHKVDNLVAVSGIDDTAPIIIHTPITSPQPENVPVTILATITDNVAVTGAKVYYRTVGSSAAYTVVDMTPIGGNMYSAVIPGTAVKAPAVDYYIWATDNNANTATHPAANAVTNPHRFTVTDTTRPTILWVNPPHTSTNNPLKPAISAKFSEAMDQATVNNAFSISPSVPGVLSWVDDIITFTPSTGLATDTVYTVTITNAAADLAGNTMLNTFSWWFRTQPGGPDTQQPKILGVTPPDGSTDVALMPTIAVTFSEAMDKDECQWAYSIAPAVAGTFSWVGDTMIFTPQTNLAQNTTYSLAVGAGAKDLAGNAISNPTTWQFTTGTTNDTTGPTVTAHTPMGTGVPINSKITATFSELMNISTVNAGTFTVSPAVPGTFAWDGNKVTYVTGNLALNTTYTVTISDTVTDYKGNKMEKPYSWSFTTGDYIGIDLYEGTENITYYDGRSDGTAIKEADHGYELTTVHDGVQSEFVRYSYPGTGWGGYWGGTLPVAGLDISAFNGVKFWLKGDGSNNTIRLTFKESNLSGADGETWNAPEVSLSNTAWKLIEIPYTQFTRDPYGVQGNGVFTKNINAYTMVYVGTNTSGTNHYVDTLIAGNISDTTAPTSVEGIAMNKSGANLTLIWKPATDNVAVDHYNVYRGTSATFVPDITNRIGTSTTTSYTDPGALTAVSSYYYKVTALDGIGNESAPSNVGYKLNQNMTFHTSISNINWISLPAITPYKKASDIAADIPNCTKVARFNPNTQTYENWEDFFGWSGTDFNVVTGESYAVIISANSAAALVGWYKPYTVNMTFHTTISNINWTSLPYNSTYTKASDMVPVIPNVTKLARFNPNTQLYENWEDFFGWSGTDFGVVPGEGYAVIINNNSTFTPTAVQ